MNPTELARICNDRWGYGWQTKMAKWVPCSPRTVRRWAAGDIEVPAHVAVRLRRDHAQEMEQRLREPAVGELQAAIRDLGHPPQISVAVRADSQKPAAAAIAKLLNSYGVVVTVLD